MPIINLEQGSQEWLDYRKKKVMATDIPVILGSNPWKKKLELWEEKLGLRPPTQMNDAMRRGQKLEPIARKLACELIGIDFRPVVIESTKYPWLAASLDGISELGRYILEIKCTKLKTHLEAIEQCFPKYYQDQVYTQLEVSQAEICYYFNYCPEYEEKPYAIIEVYPNHEKEAEIISKGYEFYVQMCTMRPPVEWELKKR